MSNPQLPRGEINVRRAWRGEKTKKQKHRYAEKKAALIMGHLYL